MSGGRLATFSLLTGGSGRLNPMSISGPLNKNKSELSDLDEDAGPPGTAQSSSVQSRGVAPMYTRIPDGSEFRAEHGASLTNCLY